jgi:hypothetical protein
VGAALPPVGGLWRRVAERPDGRRALVELGRRPPGRPWGALLDGVVDEVEAWSDAEGFLPVLAAGRVGESEWVARVMEAPRGQSLSSLLGQPMSPARVVQLGQAVARALTAAHARSLVHGDLSAERLHVAGDRVDVEPGGFEPLLSGSSRGRADDVEQLGRLLASLLSGAPGGSLRPDAPPDLAQVIRDALAARQGSGPTADQLWASLRDLKGSYGDPTELTTPVSASRTIAPRIGEVDVRLPPAPPPAPELRSVVPVHERRLVPAAPREVPRSAVVVAGLVLALMLTLLALWWW